MSRLRLAGQLQKQLANSPTSDELHAVALFNLMSGSHDQGLVRSASAYLLESLSLANEPRRRARILSDLAAAQLLLGEILQSPLEIGAGLESALESLELDPNGPEATFNRSLALHLLGIESLPFDTRGDPWLEELRRRLQGSADQSQETVNSGCWSRVKLLQALDAWSFDPTPGGRGELVAQRRCWSDAADQFHDGILAEVDEQPSRIARAWSGYRAIERDNRAFDVPSASSRLRTFYDSRPPELLVLAVRWIEASLAYYQLRYDESLAMLEELVAKTEAGSFCELSGRTHRLIALIAQVRGRYSVAARHLSIAREKAICSGSTWLQVAVDSLEVELEEIVGREDDAWRALTRALRNAGALQPVQRLLCLHSGARLARYREFDRVAGLFTEKAVEVAAALGPTPRISALKTRGHYRASIGRRDLGRQDLALARQLLDEQVQEGEIASILRADLLYLEGLVAEMPDQRHHALAQTVEHYRATEYNQRIVVAQTELARLTLDQGDSDEAMADLRGAFAELAEQVSAIDEWASASTLMASGRALAGDLVALELDRLGPRVAIQTLGRFLSLRGSRQAVDDNAPETQRLTFFVRDDEVLVFLQRREEVVHERIEIRRQRLMDLRDLLLLQLRSEAPEARLRATSEKLGALLLDPIAAHLTLDQPLVIVADGVLTGLPFSLLRFGQKDEMLIDRATVSLATDFHQRVDTILDSQLVVGVKQPSSELAVLALAEEEARRIARTYPRARLLVGDQAKVADVRRALVTSRVAHFASHFVANLRHPQRSYLALTPEDGDEGHLSLEDLLQVTRHGLSLLYLSGCDTGRSLPKGTQGIHGLADVFAASGIERTVLSLWPLDDRVAMEIAVDFHQLVSDGRSAAEALRTAQLRHRDKHPALWAPLVLYH